MIGFQPLIGETGALNLDMYRFLIAIIREEDQINGDKFIQRYLQGPQLLWKQTVATARYIPVLWDVANVPDQYLWYLKDIVGWTKELDEITSRLDPLTLRRLIAASVAYWKRRGPEDAVIDLISLVTGARCRIWNWFDYRIVLDESAFGEDWNGYDPWMASLPGPPNDDEMRSNIRVVDDGTLDHELVVALAKLGRPAGERIEVSYIGFLDLFGVDDDLSQWDETDGVTVADGKMTLATGESAFANLESSQDWANYVVTARLMGDGVFQAYRTGSGDYYYAQLDVDFNQILVGVVVAGVPTVLATVNMALYSVMLHDDVHYSLRLELSPEAGQTRFNVYFESALISSVLNPVHSQGSRGFSGVGGLEVDEVELFFNPLETDTIDINP
jgi:hypothetical protein